MDSQPCHSPSWIDQLKEKSAETPQQHVHSAPSPNPPALQHPSNGNPLPHITIIITIIIIVVIITLLLSPSSSISSSLISYLQADVSERERARACVSDREKERFGRLVGCLMSQQQASVSQGRICTDNFTCRHTEIEAADQTFYLTYSILTPGQPVPALTL